MCLWLRCKTRNEPKFPPPLAPVCPGEGVRKAKNETRIRQELAFSGDRFANRWGHDVPPRPPPYFLWRNVRFEKAALVSSQPKLRLDHNIIGHLIGGRKFGCILSVGWFCAERMHACRLRRAKKKGPQQKRENTRLD